MVNCGRSMVD